MKIRELAQHWEENAKGRLPTLATRFIWTLKPLRVWQRLPRCTPNGMSKNCSAN
ncbi:hypothetical protein PMI19_00467 [Pseudomonas sp. GM16]|nr:hypothetical protein PMI19_00467 [Pseudomonas sp. GM16]